MPSVYEELRVIARQYLAGRDGEGNLTATSLVYKAWVKARMLLRHALAP
jgi:hypothetical protein